MRKTRGGYRKKKVRGGQVDADLPSYPKKTFSQGIQEKAGKYFFGNPKEQQQAYNDPTEKLYKNYEPKVVEDSVQKQPDNPSDDSTNTKDEYVMGDQQPLPPPSESFKNDVTGFQRQNKGKPLFYFRKNTPKIGGKRNKTHKRRQRGF